jgi:hypothetical protein
MKKQIVAVLLVLTGVGVLAFLLVRADRIIQRQQQALKELSAKAGRPEHGSASAAGSAAADDGLKAEVDRLHRSVAKLQAQLDEVQKKVQIDQLGRTVQSGDFKDRIFKFPANPSASPYSQGPAAVPPGSIPFEFNGMTYYRIPLAFAK